MCLFDTAMNDACRIERDCLGELPVPAEALHGIHTQRALDNFPLAQRSVHPELVRAYGDVVADPQGGLTHLFPTPQTLAAMDPSDLAMPQSRRRTLMGLVEALAQGRLDLDLGADWREARVRLKALHGFGPWTVESIAMRSLGDPDAFISGDLGIKLAACRLGMPTTAQALTDHSHLWRPWRSYAVQYLWATGDHPINRMPDEEAA